MRAPSIVLSMLSSVTLGIATRNSTSTGTFRLVAGSAHPDLHLEPLNANNHRIWLNKATESYCPFDDPKQCPPGTETTFRTAYDGYLDLNVEASGGQLVYVTPAGQVAFTDAHTGLMDSSDSIQWGWHTYLPEKGHFGLVSWKDAIGFGAFAACPGTGCAWQVFLTRNSKMPAGREHCEVIVLLVTDDEVKGPSAFEYP